MLEQEADIIDQEDKEQLSGYLRTLYELYDVYPQFRHNTEALINEIEIVLKGV